MTIFQNYPLVASICSILFAQFVKFPIAYFSKKPDAHVSLVTSTGGMPSSHSAAVSSLITALIIEYRFTSPLVESSALKHVEVESEDDHINIFDTEENKKLIIKKYLGHKPVEVFAGVLTGIIMAFILRMFY